MASTPPISNGLQDMFKASLRRVAASVSLLASKDQDGIWHGMAVSSAASLSLDPPSMFVAVNKSASVYAVIERTSRFSLSLMAETHEPLLERYTRKDLRDRRFEADHWIENEHGIATLTGALSTYLCDVIESLEFGTHTIFVGLVTDVMTPRNNDEDRLPLVWHNGSKARISLGLQPNG